jgi:hypothetical protein
MPAHYETLIDQLERDIIAAVPGAIVRFGTPRREITVYPQAIVRTAEARSNEIRKVVERYEFEIEVRLPVPAAAVRGWEPVAMVSAAALTYVLAPYSVGSMPPENGGYAGVGAGRYVTNVTPIASEDADGWIGYRLTFATTARANQ